MQQPHASAKRNSPNIEAVGILKNPEARRIARQNLSVRFAIFGTSILNPIEKASAGAEAYCNDPGCFGNNLGCHPLSNGFFDLS